jgi:hypothetical protein
MPHRDLIRRRLGEILAPRVKEALAALAPATPIALHVRRGDARRLALGDPYVMRRTYALPLEWFIGCLRSVRDAIGADLPATIFSDGREEELRPLLDLPNVALAPPSPSIVDLFSMARSPLLITTGSSTFSGWACYLGNGMASLWYPGSTAEFGSKPAPGATEADLHGRLGDAERQRIIRALTPAS